MSIRENIASHIVTQIGNISEVKTVTREPTDISQLAVTSFPHVLVESANETRETISIGDTPRRESTLDFLINVVVHGNNRDTSRNSIMEKIEEKLALDRTLSSNASDSFVSEIIIREIAETKPFGQGAIVYTAKYYYASGNV
jgi:endonuclease III